MSQAGQRCKQQDPRLCFLFREKSLSNNHHIHRAARTHADTGFPGER